MKVEKVGPTFSSFPAMFAKITKKVETFRFEDENDYEYEIRFKVFRVLSKIDTPEFFIVLFFTRKDSTVIVTEGG